MTSFISLQTPLTMILETQKPRLGNPCPPETPVIISGNYGPVWKYRGIRIWMLVPLPEQFGPFPRVKHVLAIPPVSYHAIADLSPKPKHLFIY